ncbi:hypothetical protein [Methylobacterium sp. Leaf88]|uniref:hypothetical protein n=1 Tax=Methylobacterium sp. Leaf88 TaxID=1736244 RepID=UPI0012E8CF57|nr:hypothetical protein [Methylobacterium sp. Leaf88]
MNDLPFRSIRERMTKLPSLQRQSFSVSEAEQMTGRSPQSQRHDRRLGFTEPLDGGKARYNVFKLAEMLVLQTLVNRGIKVEDAAGVARDAAQQVAWWALSQPGKIIDPTGKLEAVCQRLDVAPVALIISSPLGGFDYFRYCIMWPNKPWTFCDEIEKALADARATPGLLHGNEICSTDATTAGAMILLDLEAIGQLLASRTERPFIVGAERAE